MSLCQDCKKEVEYGRSIAGVCHPCRAKRAAKVKSDRDKLAGRLGGKRKGDW